MPHPMPREIPIPTVGAKVHDVNFSEAVELIVEWAREGSGGYVSTPNVDHLVRARRDPKFKELMMGARLRVPDGMGLIYGSRLAGTPFRGAVTGRLLPEAIVRPPLDDPLPIAIIGGRDDAPQKAKARTRGLGGKVVAAVGPPMGFVIGGPDDDKIVQEFVAAQPRIMLVGFGAPNRRRGWRGTRPSCPRRSCSASARRSTSWAGSSRPRRRG